MDELERADSEFVSFGSGDGAKRAMNYDVTTISLLFDSHLPTAPFYVDFSQVISCTICRRLIPKIKIGHLAGKNLI